MFDQLLVKLKCSVWLNGYLIVCAVVIVFFPSTSFSQDKIYKTDKTIIEAKVQEVGDAEIRYKKFSNQNGPVYTVKKDYVWMIIYENGEKEIYNQVQPKQQVQKPAGIKRSSVNNPADQFNNDKARNFILTEKINDAIASYSILLTHDSTNATLLAEDAYALALGGIYEAALMRLDRSWSIGANTPDVNYFTAQVFALMGYDDLSTEFWNASGKYKIPAWISSESAVLLQKFKRKSPTSSKTTREELISNFKHANELASQNLYFQSIALFRKTIDLCPDQYVLYFGYSIALEKAGALEKSAQATEKAISLVGNKADERGKKQVLEQRLVSINRKLASLPSDAMPGLIQTQKKVADAFRPQMMAYAGGMLAADIINVNCRIGYFISGSSNASFDFGVSKNLDVTSVNLGLSGYYRKNIFVCGGGLLVYSGNASTTLSVKISVGISVQNKNQTSSFDVFLDGSAGLTKNSLTTVGLSIGKSIYFGKRK